VPGALDRRSGRPAYQQIADRLRSHVLDGTLGQGSRLPSETELIEMFGASRGTARQALAVLRAEGLIEVRQGKGAFVRARPPIRRVAHDRFARHHRESGRAAFLVETEGQGLEPQVQVENVGPEELPAWVAPYLGRAAGDPVLVRRRRYLADEEPVELATSYLPLDLVEGTRIAEVDTGPGGIYARLEELGHELAEFTEEVSARMPHPDEARSLDLASGVPVLRVVRRAVDVDGTVLEVCETIKAADRFVLAYELPAS
jgi:GntR family transcriptional regulator